MWQPNLDVRYLPRHFASHLGPALQTPTKGDLKLVTSYLELLWALIMVGHVPSTFARLPDFLFYHVVHRIGLLHSFFEPQTDHDGRSVLGLSRHWHLFDPSERSYASYFAGLMFAKLLADRLHSVPNLMHVDVYRGAIHPGFWSLDNKKPDLVGCDRRGGWHVVEAKGRSSRPSPASFPDYKRQTLALRTIGGNYPVLRVVGATFLNSARTYQTIWEDPPAVDDDPDEGWDLNTNAFESLRAYYDPLFTALQSHAASEPLIVDGVGTFVAAQFTESVRVGLTSDIWAALQARDRVGLVGLANDFEVAPDARTRTVGDRSIAYIASDGVVVEVRPLDRTRKRA